MCDLLYKFDVYCDYIFATFSVIYCVILSFNLSLYFALSYLFASPPALLVSRLCVKMNLLFITADNGFNPLWNDICEFEVANPDFALIRIIVQDEDMFGDPNFIGQATYPIKCLRSGYRSIPLTNGFSEELELSSLLVHLTITKNVV